MNLIESLLGAQNGAAGNNIARQFGLNDQQTRVALDALLPGLVAGLRKNTQSSSGMDALIGALGKGNHQRYMEDATAAMRPEGIEDGKRILGHILGSKDVSRQVARSASQESGVDYGVLKQMLPVVASMVMGQLSQQKQQQGSSGVGGMLESLFGGKGGVSQRRTGGFLQSMLDSDGDGSMADDLLNMAGGLFGRR